MANYPASLPDYDTKKFVNNVTDIIAVNYNYWYNEVLSIATELGLNPRGAATDLVTRLAISLTLAGKLKLLQTCTNATRPDPGTAGMIIYETDTKDFFGCVVGGAAPTWRQLAKLEDVQDAIDKAHTQGTDLGLDDGGDNPITAAALVLLKDREKYADSPMLVTGGEISEGTNAGTFKVAAITITLLRTTDSAIGELAKVTLAEQDNQAITLADTKYYVHLNYNAGNPTITISTSRANGTTNIGIGEVMKDGSDNVHFCNCGMRLGNGVAKLHRRAANLRAIELASGCTIAYQATREFTMTAGIIYQGINIFTPFVGGDEKFDSAVDKFIYCYRDTDVWQYTANSTVIDDDNYDNNTAGKGSIAVNQYGVHWVYVHPDDEDVYVVYGRDSYKLAEAEEAQPPGDLPGIIGNFGLLIGKIIIKKDATSFATVQMVTTYFFTGTAVADHNELGNLQGGTAAEYYHLTSAQHDATGEIAIEFVIDGGGSAITTGIKGDLEIPFGCTIKRVTLLADQSGSIIIDIWKDSYANFPPTDADSITAAAPPTITTATKSQDATLTDWTVAITAGDILRFNVDSITTIERCTVSLWVEKT